MQSLKMPSPILAIIVGPLLISVVSAHRCPENCQKQLVNESRTCRATCPKRKAGRTCRAACRANFVAETATCKGVTNPMPPNCGAPTTITTATTATSTTTTTTSLELIPCGRCVSGAVGCGPQNSADGCPAGQVCASIFNEFWVCVPGTVGCDDTTQVCADGACPVGMQCSGTSNACVCSCRPDNTSCTGG
jgi:hypothetical protein